MNVSDRDDLVMGPECERAFENVSLAVDVQRLLKALAQRREIAGDGLGRHPRQAARRCRPYRSTMTTFAIGCRRRTGGGHDSRRDAPRSREERPIGFRERIGRRESELVRCEEGCWKGDGLTVRKEFWVDWG